jgi:hypothetical protein
MLFWVIKKLKRSLKLVENLNSRVVMRQFRQNVLNSNNILKKKMKSVFSLIFFTEVFKKKQIYHVRNLWVKHQKERHSENKENNEECWHCDIERWRKVRYRWKKWLNWQRFKWVEWFERIRDIARIEEYWVYEESERIIVRWLLDSEIKTR